MKLPDFVRENKSIVVEKDDWSYGPVYGVIDRVDRDMVKIKIDTPIAYPDNNSLSYSYLYCNPYRYGDTWFAYEVI